MSNVVAIALTIQMCMVGVVEKEKCEDGTEPFAATMSIMTGTASEDCQLDWNAIRKCVHKWDSVIELKRNDDILFVLYPDGTLKTDNGFKADQAALVFYKGVAKLLDENVLKK